MIESDLTLITLANIYTKLTQVPGRTRAGPEHVKLDPANFANWSGPTMISITCFWQINQIKT